MQEGYVLLKIHEKVWVAQVHAVSPGGPALVW